MNEQELNDYAAYLKSQGQSDEDVAAYIDYLKSQQPPEKVTDKIKNAALATVGGVGSALDYLGGLSRTGVAALAGQAGLEEAKQALKGEAPTTSQYLEKAGIPEGYSLSDILPSMYTESGEGLPLKKGGMFDPTARGAVGFAGDVALDPLTYLSFGAAPAVKAAAKLGKAGEVLTTAAKPLSTTAKKVGPDIYKSGLKKIEQQAEMFGKKSPSEVLMKEGVWGSAKSVQKQMDELAGRLQAQKMATQKAAGEAGVQASMERATEPLTELIKNFKSSRDPMKQSSIGQLQSLRDEYLMLDPQRVDSLSVGGLSEAPRGVTPLEASAYKTSLYESAPTGVFKDLVTAKEAPLVEGRLAMARGLKQEEEILSPIVKAINEDLGSLLTTKDKQRAAAWLEQNKNAMTQVDAGMIAASLRSGDPIWISLLTGKQIGKGLQSTAARTGIGLGLERFGTSKAVGPGTDVLLRELIRKQGEE